MMRKSTGVSIHNNLDCLVLARRLLRPTHAAAGAFHRSILHRQPAVLAVFLRLHEFLQEQVCERTKYLLL